MHDAMFAIPAQPLNWFALLACATIAGIDALVFYRTARKYLKEAEAGSRPRLPLHSLAHSVVWCVLTIRAFILLINFMLPPA